MHKNQTRMQALWAPHVQNKDVALQSQCNVPTDEPLHIQLPPPPDFAQTCLYKKKKPKYT